MFNLERLRALSILSTLLVFIIVVHDELRCTKAESVTLMKRPKESVASNVAWSWTSIGPSGNDRWAKTWIGGDTNLPPQYSVCQPSPSTQPNQWLTSKDIHVHPANRIDITIEYAMVNCSDQYLKNHQHCRHNFSLYLHRSATRLSKIPDPYTDFHDFEKIGTLIPEVLIFGMLSGSTNNETFSVIKDAAKPYVYLAFRYQGGCVSLFSVSVHYYRCPSVSLSSNLIHLPLTTAPGNGSVQVKGSCSQYTKQLTNESDLYGYCKDDGEWSSDFYHGECGCDYGYGKFAVHGGSECRECPLGTYKNTVSNSKCITCPLNSVQDSDRVSCNCKVNFYRTDKETKFDNCTGIPSAPQNLTIVFFNATIVTMTWSAPSENGGRSDLYYTVKCKQCNDQGEECTIECTYSDITVDENFKLATIKKLSSYTYYQFKVYAMNGVSKVAEKNNEDPKYAEKALRTKESIPGSPEITVKQLNSTSVFLSWELKDKNGVIKYYIVTYFLVNQPSNVKRFNTTLTNTTITGLETGKEYRFQVQASSSLGLGQPASETRKVVKTKKETSGLSSVVQGVIGGIVGALILVLIIIIICLCRRKSRRRTGSKENLAMSPGFFPLDENRMYIDPSNYGSPMEALLSTAKEIDRQNIELENKIGGGEFADVYKGKMKTDSGNEVVAVKILKPRSSYKNREDFIREASIMGQFNHTNVIGLKGVVTSSADTPMMIVTEYMANGSLDHFLKSHDGKFTALQLLGMIRGVADGMAYLSAMNFIHRDIAARNILVADNMASKVADFGLSRELDDSVDNPNSVYQTQGGKIPVRWTAPEAIRYKKFSSASDVWSFGILMWEIMSFAERPYWDWDNFEVMDRVDSGYRLPAPMNCPKAIHNLMLDCWEADKNKRPKFTDIVKRADELIRSPDKLNDAICPSRFLDSVGAETNFGEVTSVEEWLDNINMGRYVNTFEQAGYSNLETIKAMSEEDLTRIGIKLVGHRNKINKSIKAMKKHFDQRSASQC